MVEDEQRTASQVQPNRLAELNVLRSIDHKLDSIHENLCFALGCLIALGCMALVMMLVIIIKLQ